MMTINTDLEPRLHKRYEKLVTEHLSVTQTIAAGLRSLPGRGAAFASTQAAWRFYANPHVSVARLSQPLLACGQRAVEKECARYALLVHDLSDLNYHAHTRKRERVQLYQGQALGYRLHTALLVSDVNGEPLAPLAQTLWTDQGLYTTRAPGRLADAAPLDEVTAIIRHTATWACAKPFVHLYDRGGDSVGHYRQWLALGALFVVRADARQRVQWGEKSPLLGEIPAQLEFRFSRTVRFKGRKARQYIAETAVTITRAARPHRQRGGVVEPRRSVPGPPVALRLVVSQVRDAQGTVLAEWLLLTNVAASVAAQTIALWYYWRWEIESYFKLLKRAGHHIEQWQQQTPQALLKRLLVVSLACVVVWQLGRAEGAAAAETRALLVRLSGRQMKWGVESTPPALLAGLWVLLTMLDALQHYEIDQLKQFARTILPYDKRFNI